MYLEIVTPTASVFEGEVDIVTFPGSDGSFQVMNDHAPLISTLSDGEVVYKSKNSTSSTHITGGVVEVLNNKIVVLADGLAETE